MLSALSFALWNLYLERGLRRGGTSRLALLTMTLAVAGTMLPLAAWEGASGRAAGGVASGAHLVRRRWTADGGRQPVARRPGHPPHRRIPHHRPAAAGPFVCLRRGRSVPGEYVRPLAGLGVGLIVAALWLLRRDAQQEAAAEAGSGQAPSPVAGLAFGIASSFFFTLGRVARKLGLALVPSAILSSMVEGLVGLLVVAPTLLGEAGGRDAAAAFRAGSRDRWLSGLAAAAGTLCINTALQHASVPVAVALGNTSPWFTLFLAPRILGAHRRPGRWVWAGTALLTAGTLAILAA